MDRSVEALAAAEHASLVVSRLESRVAELPEAMEKLRAAQASLRHDCSSSTDVASSCLPTTSSNAYPSWSRFCQIGYQELTFFERERKKNGGRRRDVGIHSPHNFILFFFLVCISRMISSDSFWIRLSPSEQESYLEYGMNQSFT